MRISSKGQITIPLDIRTKLGLFPNTELDFSVKDNVIILQKHLRTNFRGKKLIAQLSGKSSVSMSTDDIMKLTRS